MRIRILKSRDFTPPDLRRITYAFREGHEVTIKRSWGEALVAEGDAEEIDVPPRIERDLDGDGHDDETGHFVEGNTVARRRGKATA